MVGTSQKPKKKDLQLGTEKNITSSKSIENLT